MTIISIALATFAATLLGGLFALRWSDKLHLILGFSAGAVIGVAFFDLMPEALELGGGYWNLDALMIALAGGFVLYLLLDRLFFMHCHEEDHDHRVQRGRFGAGSLSLHSFLDGAAIGVAFHVSPVVGAVVASAVLAHDFSDGIDTVGMILRHGGTKRQAFKWLVVDAVAPVLGLASTFLFTIPESTLALVLMGFCGFFIYIGASDLLPESHHQHPTRWTTFATALGMGVIYMAVHFAGV
ncbi:MAG TPA: ZIP family metal transporter [Candidatus Paceibacterota bacterium]|nr:ZIP family metal transporter [Candidatus Paceibacterota bacterium]